MVLENTCTVYSPRGRNARGSIIGIPGFVHNTEDTRLARFLTEMSAKGFNGVLPHYAEVDFKDSGELRQVTCNLTPTGYISALKTAFKMTKKDSSSVVASSIGAWFLAQYLIDHPNTRIDNLFLINPLTCYDGLAREFRERLEATKPGEFADISTGSDITNRLERRISHNSIGFFRSHNPYNALRRKHFRSPRRTITFIGKEDRLVDPHTMKSFHDLLVQGKSAKGEIYTFDSGHDMPYDLWAPKAKELLKR